MPTASLDEALGKRMEQRPTVEASDINDGDLINATRTIDLGNGTAKYVYVLPNGQSFESAPIQTDLLGKAIFVWLDAVRSELVSLAGAPGLDAREAQLRAQRDAQFAGPGIVPDEQATDAALSAAVGHIPGTPPRRSDYGPAKSGVAGDSAPLPSDAKGFARYQLKEAKSAVQILKGQILSRQSALKQAEKSVKEWQAAVAALNGKVPTKRRK